MTMTMSARPEAEGLAPSAHNDATHPDETFVSHSSMLKDALQRLERVARKNGKEVGEVVNQLCAEGNRTD